MCYLGAIYNLRVVRQTLAMSSTNALALGYTKRLFQVLVISSANALASVYREKTSTLPIGINSLNYIYDLHTL